MEVHHHSHTQRKKFTHYLWEFLMLFLAVFCGFLAENFREHQVEHQREKEYMVSLVEDLQTDTAKLNFLIPFGQGIIRQIDKLISFINNEPPRDSIEKLYQLNNGASRVVQLDFEDRTSAQLKNAGNMRLVRNKIVADSIRAYWSRIKQVENIGSRLEDMRLKASDVSAKLFNNRYLHYSDPDHPLSSDIIILPAATLITDDPKLLAEYANRRFTSMIVLTTYINTLIVARLDANNLIQLIRKEYHLK
jgi:hypothetical protein